MYLNYLIIILINMEDKFIGLFRDVMKISEDEELQFIKKKTPTGEDFEILTRAHNYVVPELFFNRMSITKSSSYKKFIWTTGYSHLSYSPIKLTSTIQDWTEKRPDITPVPELLSTVKSFAQKYEDKIRELKKNERKEFMHKIREEYTIDGHHCYFRFRDIALFGGEEILPGINLVLFERDWRTTSPYIIDLKSTEQLLHITPSLVDKQLPKYKEMINQ